MDKQIAELNLFTKDYTTHQKADTTFAGEVILQDDDFKQYVYRFFQQEDGSAIHIEINFKDEEIKIEERTDVVIMKLSFLKGKLKNCQYRFLDNGMTMDMKTLLVESTITPELVEFVYDLYDGRDISHPITRNVLTIRNEAKRNIC